MRKSFATVMWIVSAVSFAQAAQAAFDAQLQAPAPVPGWDRADNAVVTQLGAGVAVPATGFASELPLRQTMRLLLPQQWNYVSAPEAREPTVSWTGAGTWLDTLRQIGETYRIRFLVDWEHRTVYSEAASNTNPGTSAVGNSPPQVLDVPFELETGGLHPQLARWADRARYHLYWPETIADVSIQVPAVLSADFLEAIRQISRALQAVGTGLKLHVYEMNRALVVEQF